MAVFTNDQESLLKERLLILSDRGFSSTVSDLNETACSYAVAIEQQDDKTNISLTWRKNKCAGDDWYLGFRKRHPNVFPRRCFYQSRTSL